MIGTVGKIKTKIIFGQDAFTLTLKRGGKKKSSHFLQTCKIGPQITSQEVLHSSAELDSPCLLYN